MARHFNKYEADAKRAQAELRKERMCTRKSGYATREDALRPGPSSVYECPFCFLWHRSDSLLGRVRHAAKVAEAKR